MILSKQIMYHKGKVIPTHQYTDVSIHHFNTDENQRQNQSDQLVTSNIHSPDQQQINDDLTTNQSIQSRSNSIQNSPQHNHQQQSRITLPIRTQNSHHANSRQSIIASPHTSPSPNTPHPDTNPQSPIINTYPSRIPHQFHQSQSNSITTRYPNDIQAKITKTSKWLRKYKDLKLHLPKILAPERKKLRAGTIDLFCHQIIPLLKLAKPWNHSEEAWLHFEAAILECIHVIQKLIIKKLKVKNTSSTSNHRSSSSDPCQSLSLFSIDQQVRSWQNLAGRLRQCAELMSNQERDPDESPNTIARQ